jgi:tRNA threonylcarbamoyladenosine modification (KEOPS) complex  Pcc1 subunit
MSALVGAPQNPYVGVVRINFPNERQANIVKDCMEVDEELQPERVTKKFHIESESTLCCTVAALDLKMLRVALSSYYDMVTVSIKTLLEFD